MNTGNQHLVSNRQWEELLMASSKIGDMNRRASFTETMV